MPTLTPRIRQAILVVLSIGALLSVGKSLVGAHVSSNDLGLRWLSLRMVAAGENPYEMYRSGDWSPYARSLMEEIDIYPGPDYFPSTILPLAPFATVPFPLAAHLFWAVNLAATVLLIRSAKHLRPQDGLSKSLLLGAGLLLFWNAGLRNSLGLGQTVVPAVLALVYAIIYSRQRRWLLSGALLAVSFLKYPYVWPVVFAYFLRLGHYKTLTFALGSHAAAHLIVSFYIGSDPVSVVRDVFHCNSDVASRLSLLNAMSVPAALADYLGGIPPVAVTAVAGLLLLALAYSITRCPRERWDDFYLIGILGLVAMIGLPNKSYNAIFTFFISIWLLRVPKLGVAHFLTWLGILWLMLPRQAAATTLGLELPDISVIDGIAYATMLVSMLTVRPATRPELPNSASA